MHPLKNEMKTKPRNKVPQVLGITNADIDKQINPDREETRKKIDRCNGVFLE
jgi:hypothetical protein